MTVQTFTTSQAASQLGVSESTIIRLYDKFIPETGRQARGQRHERRLTAEEIEDIREAIKLRAEKLPDEEIKARLESLVRPAPIESSQTAPASLQPTETALAMVNALQNTLAPVVAAQQAQDARLQALEAQQVDARLQALEAQRLRVDVVFIAVGTFIAGLIVGLAVWWFQ